jgi:hypothetical protein
MTLNATDPNHEDQTTPVETSESQINEATKHEFYEDPTEGQELVGRKEKKWGVDYIHF